MNQCVDGEGILSLARNLLRVLWGMALLREMEPVTYEDRVVSRTVVFKHSVAIALLTLAQAVLPPMLAGGCLYALARYSAFGLGAGLSSSHGARRGVGRRAAAAQAQSHAAAHSWALAACRPGRFSLAHAAVRSPRHRLRNQEFDGLLTPRPPDLGCRDALHTHPREHLHARGFAARAFRPRECAPLNIRRLQRDQSGAGAAPDE
jgi:hypothetical protein